MLKEAEKELVLVSYFHPGGEPQTLKLSDMAGFKAGDRILDVGCGDGSAMELLREKRGLLLTGCDTNPRLVKLAKERKLNVRLCDGVALDFPSLYFDGAVMECSFSLMDRHEELLHELFCVLKPGAVIAVSDLYMVNPDPEIVKRAKVEADAYFTRERVEGDCESTEVPPSAVKAEGVFLLKPLVKAVEDAGFEIVETADETPMLKNYIAQVLMDYGSFENMWKETLPEGVSINEVCRAECGSNTGYFCLTARKKGA